jgi:hypothetical protein
MTSRDESIDGIVMAKAKPAPWAARPRLAGMICALAFGLGLVLFLTGRLALPATGPTEAVPNPPLNRMALEDRRALVGLEAADGGVKIESLVVSQEPEVGRLAVTTGDRLVYAPPPNFNGRVSAGYEACWKGRGCRAGVVAITVRAVNDSPIARDDAAITGQGKAVAIDVLANDTDADGDRLSIRSVSDPRSVGAVRIAGNWIVWTPRPGFQGETSVPYAVMDRNGGTSRASVAIRVGPSTVAPSTRPDVIEFLLDGRPAGSEGPRDPFLQPLPPPRENDPPQAADDRVSVPAGGTVIIDVLANDRDPDGDRLSIDSLDTPKRGAARQVGDRIQFTAPFASGGEILFAYSVVDRAGARGRSFVSVSVHPSSSRSP